MTPIVLAGPKDARRVVEILAEEAGFSITGDAPAHDAPLRLDITLDGGSPALELEKKNDAASLRCGSLWQVGRGLSLLAQNLGRASFAIKEVPCFQRCGMMFDASRNAVPKPEAMRYFLRKMALMGLNTAMLYTEDTYEVEGEPYFGYLRGRYTPAELRDMDDYAAALGIEMVPCIQTLGHMERFLRWNQTAHYRDTPNVLLAGDEETYGLLEKIITAASAPFRSKRIHIGMDEAWGLGTGRYRKFNGDVPGHKIMLAHLGRVRQILARHGLQAMMWSDMYFRLASPDGLYYDLEHPVPPEVVEKAPADVDLVYWDYYNEDEAFYGEYIRRHRQFAAQTVFAGGVWTWAGPAPHYGKALAASLPALAQCKKQGVQEVLLTAWGDSGAECNLMAALYGMQLYAEYCNTGGYDPEQLAQRFAACTGADAGAFLRLTDFHQMPGVPDGQQDPANPGRTLLYQDPLLPLMEADYAGVDAAGHYRACMDYFKGLPPQPQPLAPMFDFYKRLARLLWLTSCWHRDAAPCVRGGDRARAQALCETVPDILDAIEALRTGWAGLWYATNKPYGFEVLDVRLGGLHARYQSARTRMGQFARGEIETIEELCVEKLPVYKGDDGRVSTGYEWAAIVSACKV